MENFKSFITEQKEEPYKLVVFNNTQESVRDVGEKERAEFELINSSAKKLGVEIFNVEHTGFFISEDKGKMFFNSLDFDKDGRVIKPTEDGETKYQKPFMYFPDTWKHGGGNFVFIPKKNLK